MSVGRNVRTEQAFFVFQRVEEGKAVYSPRQFVVWANVHEITGMHEMLKSGFSLGVNNYVNERSFTFEELCEQPVWDDRSTDRGIFGRHTPVHVGVEHQKGLQATKAFRQPKEVVEPKAEGLVPLSA